MSTEEPTKNKRGGCLTVFLIAVLVISPLYIIIGLFPPSAGTMQYLPKWSSWAIYGMALLGVVNLVSAIAMWKWKKWGVIGFAVAILGFFTLNILRGGVSLPGALLGIVIGFAILIRLVRPVWQKMT